MDITTDDVTFVVLIHKDEFSYRRINEDLKSFRPNPTREIRVMSRVDLPRPASDSLLNRGSDPRVLPGDPTLPNLPLAARKRPLSCRYAFGIIFKHDNTAKTIHSCLIHPYPLHPGHLPLWGTSTKIKVVFIFVSVDPWTGSAGRTRGSRDIFSRVKVT